MKRLFSMMLLAVLVLALCSTMIACNEEPSTTTTTYNFHGLNVALPDGYKLIQESDNIVVFLYDDRFSVVIRTQSNNEGMNATELRDFYYEQAKMQYRTDEVYEYEGEEFEISKGSKNGTPYICVIKNGTEREGEILASYATSGRIWRVNIALHDTTYYDKYFNKELMIDTITGWKCK